METSMNDSEDLFSSYADEYLINLMAAVIVKVIKECGVGEVDEKYQLRTELRRELLEKMSWYDLGRAEKDDEAAIAHRPSYAWPNASGKYPGHPAPSKPFKRGQHSRRGRGV